MTSLRTEKDPSHWPPALEPRNGTPDETARKAALDWEARMKSEKIDIGISAERMHSKKSKPVKILLLGELWFR